MIFENLPMVHDKETYIIIYRDVLLTYNLGEGKVYIFRTKIKYIYKPCEDVLPIVVNVSPQVMFTSILIKGAHLIKLLKHISIHQYTRNNNKYIKLLCRNFNITRFYRYHVSAHVNLVTKV